MSQFPFKLVQFKRGIGTVLKGNRCSLSTPVNASKSGPGFYCAPSQNTLFPLYWTSRVEDTRSISAMHSIHSINTKRDRRVYKLWSFWKVLPYLWIAQDSHPDISFVVPPLLIMGPHELGSDEEHKELFCQRQSPDPGTIKVVVVVVSGDHFHFHFFPDRDIFMK